MYAHIGAARLYRSTAVYHMRISARAYLCPRFVAATEGQGYARQLSIHARHSSTPQLNGRARHKLRETHTRESRWPSVAPMSRLATDSSLLYLNPRQKQEKTALNATPVASIYLPFLLIRSHERYTGQHAAPVEETATSPSTSTTRRILHEILKGVGKELPARDIRPFRAVPAASRTIGKEEKRTVERGCPHMCILRLDVHDFRVSDDRKRTLMTDY